MSAPMSTTWKGVKRFYTRIEVHEVVFPGGKNENHNNPPPPTSTSSPSTSTPSSSNHSLYQVLIDGRALRTNGMKDLLVPSYALALVIAGEFASQTEYVLPATTPIYNLTCNAIDNYVTEDIHAAEDLEAQLRAIKLSTFDRILIQQELNDQNSSSSTSSSSSSTLPSTTTTISDEPATITRTSSSSILHSVQQMEQQNITPSHAQTSITGRNESGGMSSTGQVGTARLRDLALDNLETDSVCFRVDTELGDTSEKLLRKRQDKYYEPLIQWFKESYGVPLGTAIGLKDIDHPELAYQIIEDEMDIASPWLKAFYSTVLTTTKSSVLTLALAHNAVGIEEAFQIARLEEEWQIDEHGFVEDGHDSQRAHLRLMLASAVTYLNLLPKEYGPMKLPSVTHKHYTQRIDENNRLRMERVSLRRQREQLLVQKKREALKRMTRKEIEDEHKLLVQKQQQQEQQQETKH